MDLDVGANQRLPVIVVGAGPVGLAAALAIRAHGIPVTVLEAAEQGRKRPGSRAIFIHRETLEHLEATTSGLGWEIARHGLEWSTKRTFYGEHLVYERTYPPPDPRRLPHSTNLSQVAIQELMMAAARKAEVRVAWEQDVTGVAVADDGVIVTTTSGRTWSAEYVVGADGASSAVRKSIGINLEGPRSDRSFVIVDVAEYNDRPRLPERVFYYEHPAVQNRNVLVVPFAGGIRVDLQLRPEDDPEQFNTAERVSTWIARILPQDYADRVTWISTYRFFQLVASRLTEEHRRALLVGEAAHLFAPFGARGLNSGIVDAIVAADAIHGALQDPTRAHEAIEHFSRTRRDAALYNRDASNLALEHMSARTLRVRARRRIAAIVARAGIRAGSWLDSSPFGPRAAARTSPTGSY